MQKKLSKKVKKYFAGFKKGCTFASVFRQSERRRRQETEYIENDEKIEIACVRHIYNMLYVRTRRRVKKVKKNNSYNEEFDPGSG